jgi:hypothetical protein
VKFSPAIDLQLYRMIASADDGVCEIAAIWREVGHRARRRKLLQPSYESVRRLVHAQRRAQHPAWPSHSRLKRAAILTYELVFQTRPARLVILDAITGDDIDRRPHLYTRRARDGLSRAPGATDGRGPSYSSFR